MIPSFQSLVGTDTAHERKDARLPEERQGVETEEGSSEVEFNIYTLPTRQLAACPASFVRHVISPVLNVIQT